MNKAEQYETVHGQVMAVLDGENNVTARMATVVCLLRDMFGERYYWTGFYVVDPLSPAELVVGAYQGTLGCLRIAFGRGVCGLAAAEQETQIVADVHAHPNHIACDSSTASEIVVPVLDASGALIAVLDVDSTDLAAFDNDDKVGLERICRDVFGE